MICHPYSLPSQCCSWWQRRRRRFCQSDGVNRGVTYARLYDDTQSDNNDNGPVDTIEELLGPTSQREDAGCVDDLVDVSRCRCWRR